MVPFTKELINPNKDIEKIVDEWDKKVKKVKKRGFDFI